MKATGAPARVNASRMTSRREGACGMVLLMGDIFESKICRRMGCHRAYAAAA
ncbi:hypothetical protein JCM31598_22570 [Desulfonatronum parangueonense]